MELPVCEMVRDKRRSGLKRKPNSSLETMNEMFRHLSRYVVGFE